jgi:MFS superfamily sulfate permease-like transporter
MLLRRTANPHVAFLGRIPGTRRFSDLARHPDNERTPGLLALRVESFLLYLSAEILLLAVLRRLRDEGGTVCPVVCDLSTSPSVNLAKARVLANLTDELANHHAAMGLAEGHAETRALLRAEDLEAKVDTIDRLTPIADVGEQFQQEAGCR